LNISKIQTDKISDILFVNDGNDITGFIFNDIEKSSIICMNDTFTRFQFTDDFKIIKRLYDKKSNKKNVRRKIFKKSEEKSEEKEEEKDEIELMIKNENENNNIETSLFSLLLEKSNEKEGNTIKKLKNLIDFDMPIDPIKRLQLLLKGKKKNSLQIKELDESNKELYENEKIKLLINITETIIKLEITNSDIDSVEMKKYINEKLTLLNEYKIILFSNEEITFFLEVKMDFDKLLMEVSEKIFSVNNLRLEIIKNEKFDYENLWKIISKENTEITYDNFLKRKFLLLLNCKSRNLLKDKESSYYKLYLFHDILIVTIIKNLKEEIYENLFLLKSIKITKSKKRKFEIKSQKQSYSLKTDNDEDLSRYILF
jgi:hypothetical protein